MLNPVSFTSTSRRDSERLHEYISDMRHLNRLVGETFDQGYRSNYAPGLDCQYSELFNHPMLQTIKQYLPEYSVTTTKTYLTEIEQQLQLIERVTDVRSAHANLLALLQDSNLTMPGQSPEAGDIFRQIAISAHSEDSNEQFADYLATVINEGSNEGMATHELNGNIDRLKSLFNSLRHFMSPELL